MLIKNELKFMSVLVSLEKYFVKSASVLVKNELKFTSVLVNSEKHFKRFGFMSRINLSLNHKTF